jgi:hypothetical protein
MHFATHGTSGAKPAVLEISKEFLVLLPVGFPRPE